MRKYLIQAVSVSVLSFIFSCTTDSSNTPSHYESSSQFTSLLIRSPNGGEVFSQGEFIPIRITKTKDEEINVVFELSIDGPEPLTWYMLSHDGHVPLLSVDTTFKFVIPDSFEVSSYDDKTASIVFTPKSVESANCYVRVRDYDKTDTVFDLSDMAFKIVPR